jgi:hypothetical protein
VPQSQAIREDKIIAPTDIEEFTIIECLKLQLPYFGQLHVEAEYDRELKYQKNIKNNPIDVDMSDSIDADKWSQRLEMSEKNYMENGNIEEAPVGDPALWTSEELFKAECIMQEITVKMSENIRKFMGLFETEG